MYLMTQVEQQEKFANKRFWKKKQEREVGMIFGVSM